MRQGTYPIKIDEKNLLLAQKESAKKWREGRNLAPGIRRFTKKDSRANATGKKGGPGTTNSAEKRGEFV